MCLSIGTPKKINFPFVPNGKFIILKCPKTCANYSLIIIGLNIGIPKNINFLFGANEKSMTLSVPILKHFRVCSLQLLANYSYSFLFIHCLRWEAEARHMYCFSGVIGCGVNFCQVFAFRSFSQKLKGLEL